MRSLIARMKKDTAAETMAAMIVESNRLIPSMADSPLYF